MSDVVLKTIIAEAGGDPNAMAAVASVIHNRAVREGKTPEQIVKAHGQFEGYSNPGPKSKAAQKDPAVVARAADVWRGVKSGTIADPTNGGTFYHASSISPYWAKAENKHGTVNIGGNVFYKGSRALDAINAAAPSPQSRPTALAYADNGSVSPKLPHISGNLGLLNQAAMNGVGPLPGKVDLQPMTPGQSYSAGNSPLARPDMSALMTSRLAPQVQPPAFRANASGGVSAGAAGNGNIALMPALPRPRPSAPLTSRSVQTVPIDPTTGNPISALQASVNRIAADRASAAPPRALTASANGRGATGAAAQGSGSAAMLPPPKVTFYAKDQIANEDAARLGDIIGRMAGTPSTPRPPSAPSFQTGMLGRSSPPSAPVVPPPPVRVASIPGPSGYTDSNKDASQLHPTTALAFGSPVQAITRQIVNPAYTAWQASQTAPLHSGQAYTAGGSVVSQGAQNAFGGMDPMTNIPSVPMPRPRPPAPPQYITQTVQPAAATRTAVAPRMIAPPAPAAQPQRQMQTRAQANQDLRDSGMIDSFGMIK